ncbi:hypothetical protein CAEBREN_10372 [Caenorhabditis brenneri]|uniref:Uncharacterized protein n=1 Tax=Caenorhabditis brenneri TaxID=135651 RepID=G0P1I0_CAEBE|nr:hypothetical protein CAEBREN_10372 [Caenorhabditis brenneri]
MGELTGKVFLEHMDAVYAASKCHLLILKASSIKDGETAKAVNMYLTKQVDGKKLMNELNRIIKGEDNFIKCENDDTDEVRSATSKLSRLSTKITTRETTAISDPLMSPVKNEEGSDAREVPEHLIELDRVLPLAFVPDETAVVCQKPTNESVFKVIEDVNQVPIGALLVVPYVNELAAKGVSVVVIDPLETSSLFQDMIRLSETCKVVRIGDFSKRNFIATGSLIKPGVPGTRLSASTLSTLLIKLTEGEASRARKPKKEVYTISGFQPKI